MGTGWVYPGTSELTVAIGTTSLATSPTPLAMTRLRGGQSESHDKFKLNVTVWACAVPGTWSLAWR